MRLRKLWQARFETIYERYVIVLAADLFYPLVIFQIMWNSNWVNYTGFRKKK